MQSPFSFFFHFFAGDCGKTKFAMTQIKIYTPIRCDTDETVADFLFLANKKQIWSWKKFWSTKKSDRLSKNDVIMI